MKSWWLFCIALAMWALVFQHMFMVEQMTNLISMLRLK